MKAALQFGITESQSATANLTKQKMYNTITQRGLKKTRITTYIVTHIGKKMKAKFQCFKHSVTSHPFKSDKKADHKMSWFPIFLYTVIEI